MPEIREIRGDLFQCPGTNSLVNCVSEDMHMGKGIAVVFKQRFKREQELKDQGAKVGGVAFLAHENRFIYYLVTKLRYNHKPRYEDLESSLAAMKDHCVKNNVKELAMPKIGCGLDKLEWPKVREMLQKVFSGTDIVISVYFL